MAGEADTPKASTAETIFIAVLELPRAERPAYLDAACGDNHKLRQRVEALLRAHEAPEGFLPEDPGAPQQSAQSPSYAGFLAAQLSEKQGDTIGHYKLLEKIGEGGCGVVYMAEQAMPVRRKVALKVIKLGMDTRSVIARFEAERQALALMDHSNIAKVLDAGATDTGRPYFVMELVGGIKITEYCDRNRLGMRQRLDLFIQVCRAIQHAHQKGIIHRDIKPSNVLVAEQDGVPVPKVIDFGIAKATEGKLTDQTVFTAFEHFLGTPAYMSPEQAQLGGLDVDTRSDIYSLGVLLYELLTGKTPFDTQDMLASGLDEMRRTIREKEPSRPSTRLKTMAAGELNTAANRRQVDAPKLLHLLRGDLDWIVMKCLQKDRARRYETANGLAHDVERHLKNEPIVARPPSRLYEFQKTVRRHKFGFAATAAVIIALAAGIVATSLEAIRARRLEREAQKALWASYLAEAHALRVSGQAGRHLASLETIKKAAAIGTSPELRNEAIASMILHDMRWLKRKDFSKTQESFALDSTFSRYAVCEKAGGVSVRRVADDGEDARLPDVGTAATSVGGFSSDGNLVMVTYADGRLRVWDWAGFVTVLESPFSSFAKFQPWSNRDHSRLFAVSDATNIVLHDLASGKTLSSVSLNGSGSLPAPAWFDISPTGERLALLYKSQTNVAILDAQTGQTLKTLQHPAQIWSVVWHPDGKHLATGCYDQAIRIWDSTTGERLRMWRADCISLGFNHRGDVLASSGWGGYTRLWDFGSGRELAGNYGFTGRILGFSSDDHRLATDGWDGTKMDFFEVTAGQGLRTLYEAPETTGNGGLGPVLERSGRLLAFKTHEGVGLLDFETPQQISCAKMEDEDLVGFDEKGENLFLTRREGLFRCPITNSGVKGRRTIGSAVLANAKCAKPDGTPMGWISANGKVCAVHDSNRCRFFLTDAFEERAETTAQPGMRYSAINSDGSLFASGAWQHPGVNVCDTRTGGLLKQLLCDPKNPDSIATVAFSPDGRYLVTGTASEYCFWNVGSWSLARRIPQAPNNDFFPMLAFSRDGRILAGTHSRNKIRLHDAATGQVLADLEAPNAGFISGLTFNHDGSQLVASESWDALRLWDLREIRRQLAEMNLDWDQPPYPANDDGPVNSQDQSPVTLRR